MTELDPALATFLNRWLSIDNDEDEEGIDGYFRFARGRNASQARSVGMSRIEIEGEPHEVAAKIVDAIDKLTQEEYRLGQAERQALYLQVIDRSTSATRHADWCCIFDPGDTADALNIGTGGDMAARTIQAVVVELMRQNRDLHTRAIGMLDYSSEIVLAGGQSDMSAALEAIEPTLTALGQNLPAILAARAAASSPGEPDQDMTPQERSSWLMSAIEAHASELGGILVRKEAELTPADRKKLVRLGAVIDQITL